MRILAIESSCDETAAAVIEDGRKILSSVVDTQIETHALYGGVVPEIASRRHMEAVVRVTEKALADADMDKRAVDAVAATCAPGLIGALLVGANFGKSLAFALGKPFIPVHHIRGHIAATYLAYPDLKPPFLTLIASGGHSEIVHGARATRDLRSSAARGTTRRARRSTRSRACSAWAIRADPRSTSSRRTATPTRYKLPDSHIKDAPLDFSFSGLKTAVINLAHNAEQKGEEIDRNGLAASFCAGGRAHARAAARDRGARDPGAARGLRGRRRGKLLPARGAAGHGQAHAHAAVPAAALAVRGQRRHDRQPGVLRVSCRQCGHHPAKCLCHRGDRGKYLSKAIAEKGFSKMTELL